MIETLVRTRLDRSELIRRARRLRWLLLDVDGVLTDGRLYYTPEGTALKAFHVRDGLGLQLLRQDGLRVGSLTSRADLAWTHRSRELGLDERIEGVHDKGAAFERFLHDQGLEAPQVAYAGDDLPDLPVIARAGLTATPADAAAEVRDAVDVVLATAGGHGAVRELAELLLAARRADDPDDAS